MSVVTSLAWVSRGYALDKPHRDQLTQQDIHEIKQAEREDLGLENYDEEPSEPVFSTVEYEPALKEIDLNSDDEAFTVKPTDAFIAVGVQKGNFSEIQVYLYEEDISNLFVHQNFLLASYPLCLQWLPYHPLHTEVPGNCLIVGSFLPEIEIWDLDLLDPVEPLATLGGLKRFKGKRKKTVIGI